MGDAPMGVLPTANSSSATIEKNTNGLASDEATEDIPRPAKGLRKSKSQNNLERVPKKTPKQKDLGRRKTIPPTDIQMESISKRLSVLGKRGRESLEESLAGLAKAKRELKNLADTPEFAKIETKPVVHEVWSNGKLVTLDPPNKKRKVEELTSVKGKGKELEQGKEKSKSQAKDAKQIDKLKLVRRPKVYLEKGLYAGQEALNLDWFARDSENYRADMEIVAPYRPNLFFPLPMWHGQVLLQTGRDFKLPFDICSPLPPGQPKPDEWRKTSSSKYHSLSLNSLNKANISKIASLVRLAPCGRKQILSATALPSACALKRMDAMKIVKIESCSMSAMTPTVAQDEQHAPIALSLNCKKDVKLAARTESVSRSSRLLIEGMASGAIAASILTRLLLNILVKSLPRTSVIAA